MIFTKAPPTPAAGQAKGDVTFCVQKDTTGSISASIKLFEKTNPNAMATLDGNCVHSVDRHALAVENHCDHCGRNHASPSSCEPVTRRDSPSHRRLLSSPSVMCRVEGITYRVVVWR